jgi:predicted TIM-barrel fold metal-dependent hydrolase
VGIDKVLLGTDYPLLKPSRYIKEMGEGGLSQADMDAVCGKNAAGLLKLAT